jgi:hypothetical protein
MQKDIDKVLQTDDPHWVGHNVETFIRRWGSAQFQSLRHHPDLGISLRAAWERVLITIPEEPQHRKLTVDRELLRWFVGFLEGRLNIEPPDWWIHGLVRAQAYRRCNVVFHELDESICHTTGRDLEVPRNTSVENVHQNVQLKIGSEFILIPTEQFERMVPPKSEFNHLSAFLSNKKCYLAVYTGIQSQNGTIFSIDRTTGKTLWESPFWGSRNATAYSGVEGFQCVAVTECRGHIFAFGIASGAAYVEAFNADDGKNLFRFATSR